MSDDRAPRPSAARDPRIGTVIGGKYLVLDRIGAGGMGRVYRAEQRPLGRVVAIKIVAVSPTAAEGSEGDVLEKRFLREASILARLSHPNVVTVHDFGRIDPEGDEPEVERNYYMAMELVAGQTLEALLHERRALPWPETVRLVRQIARGLHEAHALGVVHRDLKPANVMITRARGGEELVKLLDFGIGKIVAEASKEEPALTMEGIFVGSPGYVAPEQVMTGVVDARSDIYSLGVLMYRCLAGQSPFPQHKTAMALMTAHVHETPIALQAVAPTVPTWLSGLVHRCLEKPPALRPQTVEEILEELGTHPSAQGVPERDGIPPAAGAIEPLMTPAGRAALGVAPEPATIADRSVSLTGPRSILPAAARRRAWLFGVPAGLLLVGGVVLAIVRLGGERDAAAPPPVAPSAGSAPSFMLVIDSTPSGAHVLAGARDLGTTPLTLALDPRPLAESARVYTLQLEGYRPYAFEQGPADKTVHVVARLSREEPPAAASAPAPSAEPAPSATTPSRPAAARPAATATAKPAAAPTQTVDIQLSR